MAVFFLYSFRPALRELDTLSEQQKQEHIRICLCTRQESTGPHSKMRPNLPSHCTNAHQDFFCALHSAILAHIIPVTATDARAEGHPCAVLVSIPGGPLVSPLCPGWQHLWMS